jgi:hypothetical protein
MDGGTITGAIVSSGGSEGIAPIIALTAPTVHVAMIAMRMMERSLNQVIDMIAVRDRFMSAVRTMDMTCAFGGGGAVYGVCAAALDDGRPNYRAPLEGAFVRPGLSRRKRQPG